MTCGRTRQVSPQRDAMEYELLSRALDQRIPVLAICRGMQVLNVALGGDLFPHLPDAFENGIDHRCVDPSPDAGKPTPLLHTITLDPGSRLAEIMGVAQFEATSWHHQAVDEVGDGLVVVGRVVPGLDYRASILQIAANPLAPDEITEIHKRRIEPHTQSHTSPMPSESVSSWKGFTAEGQLSHASPMKSRSPSSCDPLATNGQLSEKLSKPSSSASPVTSSITRGSVPVARHELVTESAMVWTSGGDTNRCWTVGSVPTLAP